MRAAVIPARGLDGEVTLSVDQTEEVAPPSSVPLTMVANLRSAYNKDKNIKQTLHTLGLDLLIVSETWERPHRGLAELLASPHHTILSYCRGREPAATRLEGKHAGKLYPGKIGGGAAIIFNHGTFEAIDTEVGVPAGVEAKWCVLAPRRLEEQVPVKRICVGSIYIAPRSPYKEETITHIIQTIHLMRARYNNEIHFIIAGDFNRVKVTEVMDSYGALQQICGMATRAGAALQLVLTDLHTLLHPATALPPVQVDEGKEGKDGDHQALILAPKAKQAFKVKREKRLIKTRPMPESRKNNFYAEITNYKWEDVITNENVDTKVENFHDFIRSTLDKHMPEKSITMSDLDKPWMTPDMKRLLRKLQQERLKRGNSTLFKSLWARFRRLKREKIRSSTENVVTDLKEATPGKWHKIMKRLGGLDQSAGRLEVQTLKELSDQESAEAVAESFAAVSLEYQRLDRNRLPAFLPAGKPESVNTLEVFEAIKKMKTTKSTLPIDIPDNLRKECALDLAEPMANIINTCLRDGRFPAPWRREWVTPVPKTSPHQPKNCQEIRKIASTSDYSKIFETFLRKWIVEDIDKKININQFAGRRGVGTEHLIVMMMDRVMKLLDNPGKTAVVMGAIDWKGAFDRLDPTVNITKLIRMGVRSSLIPVIIQYIEDRRMTVRYNSAWSKWHTLVGGSPQGSWLGQTSYITASDDAADWMEDQDKFKYCDDLSILELIQVGELLVEYDFRSHVASDVAIGNKFIQPTSLQTQHNLNQIATWTSTNLMQLNEKKTQYIIFNRIREEFDSRLSVNEKVIDRVKHIKLLGVWLQEDGGWDKNTQETCKRAYSRIGMLTKLKYAGISKENLILLYKLHIRSCLEYCVVAWHSSLSSQQAAALERCQAVCLRIILQEMYITYESALEMTGIEDLATRREQRCATFSQKCIKHQTNNRLFPLNGLSEAPETRRREKYAVNFAYTTTYRNSAVPYCQRVLNQLELAKSEEEMRRRRDEEEEG